MDINAVWQIIAPYVTAVIGNINTRWKFSS